MKEKIILGIIIVAAVAFNVNTAVRAANKAYNGGYISGCSDVLNLVTGGANPRPVLIKACEDVQKELGNVK